MAEKERKQYPSEPLHAMTIDVEDYFHVSAFEEIISPSDWGKWPSRVEKNTDTLLALFDQHGIKATFFVLGWVAEREPQLIRRIQQQGHEIASHGYSHQLIYNQSQDQFREETAKSKHILEDLTGTAIHGYRAASYSITQKSLWSLDILADLGFKWDSSIFPVRHDRYGIPKSPNQPYIIETAHGNITEFPLTAAKILGQSIPAAGGGYFRQYPYQLSRWLFAKASLKQSRPQVFYLHPWEIDPEQPRIPGASALSRFRHYTNLKRCHSRLERLLGDFSFSTISESLLNTTIHTTLSSENLTNTKISRHG